MFVTFQCNQCGSKMDLDFARYMANNAQAIRQIFCQACGNKLSGRTAYFLHELISSFREEKPDWQIAFTLPVDGKPIQT